MKNLRLMSDWAVLLSNSPPFITATGPEYKSPWRIVPLFSLTLFVTGMPLLTFAAVERGVCVLLPGELTSAFAIITDFRQWLLSRCLANGHMRHSVYFSTGLYCLCMVLYFLFVIDRKSWSPVRWSCFPFERSRIRILAPEICCPDWGFSCMILSRR
jgi:hypothetical protein